MTLNLSSSRIVIVIRSVAAINASRAGSPAAGQLTLRQSGHLNLAKSGHYNLASTKQKFDNLSYVKLKTDDTLCVDAVGLHDFVPDFCVNPFPAYSDARL
jgi:hypothetical protein